MNEKNNGLKILIAVLAILALGLGAYIYYLQMDTNTSKDSGASLNLPKQEAKGENKKVEKVKVFENKNAEIVKEIDLASDKIVDYVDNGKHVLVYTANLADNTRSFVLENLNRELDDSFNYDIYRDDNNDVYLAYCVTANNNYKGKLAILHYWTENNSINAKIENLADPDVAITNCNSLKFRKENNKLYLDLDYDSKLAYAFYRIGDVGEIGNSNNNVENLEYNEEIDGKISKLYAQKNGVKKLIAEFKSPLGNINSNVFKVKKNSEVNYDQYSVVEGMAKHFYAINKANLNKVDLGEADDVVIIDSSNFLVPDNKYKNKNLAFVCGSIPHAGAPVIKIMDLDKNQDLDVYLNLNKKVNKYLLANGENLTIKCKDVWQTINVKASVEIK